MQQDYHIFISKSCEVIQQYSCNGHRELHITNDFLSFKDDQKVNVIFSEIMGRRDNNKQTSNFLQPAVCFTMPTYVVVLRVIFNIQMIVI
jgi:hypothetical protein